jgi:uncharacterized Ntn-hydrolase superfamily protein
MQPQQRFCFRFGMAGCALAASVLPKPALATYSIAATDSQTQEVGGAITSCVGSLDVGIVYGSLPGVGVIHAQAQLDQRGRAKTRAIELLEQGVDPAAIITEITRRELDSSFASRQYGIVDLSGRAAGFTGEQAQAYKNDQQNKLGTFAYSVQGNILTSQAVLDQAAEAFQTPACDLAERLMRALEAGAENDEGDSRCTGDGIPSDSAFIQVDRANQSEPYLQLSIAGTRPVSPLPQLREMFDAWRVTHPCPSSALPAAGSGGSSAGAGGSGGVTAAAGMSAAGSGGVTAAAGTSAAGSGGITAATAMSAAGSGGVTASSAGSSGATAGSGVSAAAGTKASAPASAAGSAAGGASAATRSSGSAGAATASTTNAVEQSAPAADGGCTLLPGTPRASATWLAALALFGLTLTARRRRSSSHRGLDHGAATERLR